MLWLATLTLAEDGVAHGIEEAAGLLLLRRLVLQRRLEFLDVGIGALQRLVLEQHGLHQGVDGVRRFAQAISDGIGRVRIARGALELGEPVEKFINQLAFLRVHVCLQRLPVAKRAEDVMGFQGPLKCGSELNLGRRHIASGLAGTIVQPNVTCFSASSAGNCSPAK